MRRNQLLTLVAAALAVLALVWVGREAPTPVADGQAERLYPELEAGLNTLDRVRIEGPEGASATLERAGDTWRVAEPGGYPADVSSLRELLLALAQARRIEAKTAKPEFYHRLGLQGLDEAGSPTRRLVLSRGEAAVVDLWIGERRQGESFVRANGDAQTWLVSERLDASANPVDWLRPQVLDVDRGRIRSIAVRPRESASFSLSRGAETGPLVMAEQPLETTLKDASVDRLAGVLEDLRLAGVAPRPPADQEEDKPAHRVRFETFDGLGVLARLAKRDSRYFVQLSFEPVAPDASVSEERRAEVEVELERLRQEIQPWEIELREYDGASLALLRADLLEGRQEAGAD